MHWPKTDGNAECPACGCPIRQPCPRGCGLWRCKACRADFSVTSGTLFASYNPPLLTYLPTVATFRNEVKGKSMLAFSCKLDVQYESAFVLAHKKPMPHTLRTSAMMRMVDNPVTNGPRVSPSTATTARMKV
jgi:ribosomal protein L37AE/L43A